MIEVGFTAQGLLRLRFACSPLWETMASLRVLRDPSRHALHLPWVDCTRRAVREARLDLSGLLALMPVGHWSPDFITPPPTSPLADFDDELAVLRSTPLDIVVAELTTFSTLTPSPYAQRFLEDPERELQAMCDVVDTYWNIALSRHWDRLRAILLADVSYRAREMADRGPAHVLVDLHPAMTWAGDSLQIAKSCDVVIELDKRGLVLVPCAFVWPNNMTLVEPPWQPTIVYPPRGVGTLWETPTPAPDGLAGLLGHTRATLLTELGSPRTTTELARHSGRTTGGVSQHLSALRMAGLVSSARTGREVHYLRTPMAEDLLRCAR